MADMTDSGLESCKICEANFAVYEDPIFLDSFSHRSALLKHLREKHGEEGIAEMNRIKGHTGEFRCLVCQKTSKSKDALRKHLKSAHPDEHKALPVYTRIAKNLCSGSLCICELCGTVFSNESKLVQHLLVMHKEDGQEALEKLKKAKVGKQYACLLCKEEFLTEIDVRKHVAEKHSTPISSSYKLKIEERVCPLCTSKRQYSNEEGLLTHLRKIHKENGWEIAQQILAKSLSSITAKFTATRCQEDSCNWRGHNTSNLILHLQNKHPHIELNVIHNKMFSNAIEFDIWLREIQEESQLVWGTPYLIQKGNGRVRRQMVCSRSCVNQESKSDETTKNHKRRYQCISKVTFVAQDDGSVLLEEACLTHYGHPKAEMHRKAMCVVEDCASKYQTILEWEKDVCKGIRKEGAEAPTLFIGKSESEVGKILEENLKLQDEKKLQAKNYWEDRKKNLKPCPLENGGGLTHLPKESIHMGSTNYLKLPPTEDGKKCTKSQITCAHCDRKCTVDIYRRHLAAVDVFHANDKTFTVRAGLIDQLRVLYGERSKWSVRACLACDTTIPDVEILIAHLYPEHKFAERTKPSWNNTKSDFSVSADAALAPRRPCFVLCTEGEKQRATLTCPFCQLKYQSVDAFKLHCLRSNFCGSIHQKRLKIIRQAEMTSYKLLRERASAKNLSINEYIHTRRMMTRRSSLKECHVCGQSKSILFPWNFDNPEWNKIVRYHPARPVRVHPEAKICCDHFSRTSTIYSSEKGTRLLKSAVPIFKTIIEKERYSIYLKKNKPPEFLPITHSSSSATASKAVPSTVQRPSISCSSSEPSPSISKIGILGKRKPFSDVDGAPKGSSITSANTPVSAVHRPPVIAVPQQSRAMQFRILAAAIRNSKKSDNSVQSSSPPLTNILKTSSFLPPFPKTIEPKENVPANTVPAPAPSRLYSPPRLNFTNRDKMVLNQFECRKCNILFTTQRFLHEHLVTVHDFEYTHEPPQKAEAPPNAAQSASQSAQEPLKEKEEPEPPMKNIKLEVEVDEPDQVTPVLAAVCSTESVESIAQPRSNSKANVDTSSELHSNTETLFPSFEPKPEPPFLLVEIKKEQDCT